MENTSTDWKALCAELLKGLDENRHPEVRYPGHLRIIMANARAYLAQPEPEGPTDRELTDTFYGNCRDTVTGLRAVLARWGLLSIEPEPEGPTDEDRIKAAFAMGQTGAPSSETERLAFESWMRGHSWLVEGVWNGTTYDDRGPSRVSSVDVGAMQTRMLWAVWRDRAALARWGRPAVEPVPVSERPILKISNFNDANGHCWCGTRASIDRTGDLPVEMPSSWELREPCAQDDCVLPHYSLPIPAPTETIS